MSFAENRQPFQSAISIQNAIKIEAVKLSGAVGANLAVTHIKIPFRRQNGSRQVMIEHLFIKG